MTIASQTSRISYTGDGATTAFAVPFYFAANADLVVILQDTLGNQVIQVLGTNYNLTGATLSAGGTCTFTTAPITGYLVTVYRDPAVTQTTSYNNNDPFPAKSHELALDKLTTIVQRLKDQVSRTVHQTEGEGTLTTALATIATRANKLLGFDGTGALVYATGPTFVGNSAFGIALVDSRSTATTTLFAVSVNVIHTCGYTIPGDGGGARYIKGVGTTPGGFQSSGGQWWKLAQMEFLTPQMFGAKTDGTNAAAAMILWVASLGSFSSGFVPAGTYSLDPTTLGSTGLVLPAGATIVGVKGASKFLVTGTAASNLFTATSVSNISIEGLWCVGNGANGSQVSGTAMIINLLVGAVAAVSNFRIINNRFDNFGGDYWINIYNSNTAFAMSNIRIQNNDWYSFSGNSRTPGTIGVPATMIAISAQFNENVVTDYWIENNYADCKWVKNFCTSWSGVSMGHIGKNTIDNAGVGANLKNVGAYGILVYNGTGTETGRPKNIEISGNIVNNPISMGIYCVNSKLITIVGNDVSGQIDDTLGSLLYAGISLADCPYSSITGGTLNNNFIDVQIQGPAASFATTEGNYAISNVRATGGTGTASIRISASGGVTTWTGLTISGCDINHTVKGINFNTSSTTGVGDVVISGNRIKAPTAIFLCEASTTSTSGPIKISGNLIEPSVQGILGQTMSGGVLDINGNSFNGLCSGNHINLSTVAVNITNNTFTLQTAGSCLNLPACTGNLIGCVFYNCNATTVAGGTQLASAVPTFSASPGTFVQILPPLEQGVAASKYIITGYVCITGTTWLGQRTLTGN